MGGGGGGGGGDLLEIMPPPSCPSPMMRVYAKIDMGAIAIFLIMPHIALALRCAHVFKIDLVREMDLIYDSL